MLLACELLETCGRGFVFYFSEVVIAGFFRMEFLPFSIGAVFIEFIHRPGINDATGNPAFDLMVTLLAWCFGDALEQPLAHALLDGYRAAAPLDKALLSQCYDEARAAAVRFAITRITDYELRPQGTVVYKDYRRFMRRLAAVEAIGADSFVPWLLS